MQILFKLVAQRRQFALYSRINGQLLERKEMRNPCQCESELSQAIALVRVLWCTYIEVEPE